VKDKNKITIRFQATNEIAGEFGLRLIRADAGR
jgi:hypothetical protein